LRLSELSRQRWRRFKAIKRSYLSLWVLLISFCFSLCAPWLVSDQPLAFSFKGRIYTPAFSFYRDADFGGLYQTEANYRQLFQHDEFQSEVSWSIFPLIQHHPLHSDLDQEGSPPYAPSSRHWLGTDQEGRSMLARLIYGYRNSMSFAILLTLITSILGVVIGGLQGYLGGKWDFWGQRAIEIWSALPFLYVVIVIGSIYGRSFFMLIAITSIFSWIGLSYYMRGEFLKLKGQTYVHVAQALGLPTHRIFFHHILPNGLTPVVTLLPFSLIGGISALTSLDFLGFGLNPPTASWGELLKQGLDNLHSPWIAIFTVMALFTTLLLAAFVGEGVREAYDPKAEA
jgi:microcin C transport system permease protein